MQIFFTLEAYSLRDAQTFWARFIEIKNYLIRAEGNFFSKKWKLSISLDRIKRYQPLQY